MWICTLKPKAGGVPSRLLKLEGASNFRDLGGYPAEGSSTVRRHKLFRSGGLSGLTPADYRRIDRLGLKVVFDLRTPEECIASPTGWAAMPVKHISLPSEAGGNMGAMATALSAHDVTAEAVSEMMLSLYRTLPYHQAPAFSSVFRHLADNQLPVLFHCTAGKDRTGVLAALILSILGVPERLIVQDYALSDKIVDYRAALNLDETQAGRQDGYELLRAIPAKVVAPLLMSHPSYIAETFRAARQSHGSVEQLVKSEYRITDEHLEAIRANLLE